MKLSSKRGSTTKKLSDPEKPKRMNEAKTKLPPERGFTAARLLECGHRNLPNNLKDGKCGTCWLIKEIDAIADTFPGLRDKTDKLIEAFRGGDVWYDTNGKTLVEWERMLRPHSNGEAQATQPKI